MVGNGEQTERVMVWRVLEVTGEQYLVGEIQGDRKNWFGSAASVGLYLRVLRVL